jgi:hypothetical protein
MVAGEPRPKTPIDMTIRINGQQVAQGRVPRMAPSLFTVKDAFDVRMDSYSPVSEAYYDRRPFKCDGTIDRLHVKSLEAQ